MLSKIIRTLISFLGVLLGITSYLSLEKYFPQISFGLNNVYLVGIIVGLVVGILFYLISPWIFSKVREFVKILDKEISKYPQTDILLGVVGLIVGLVIAYLLVGGLLGSISGMPLIKMILSIIIYIFMGYIGVKITLKSRDDLFNINKLSRLSSNIGKDKSSKKDHGGKSIPPKVLDTSVIIDGRIADICRTGFVEGKLIIPKFVLNELQHIADSSDDLKRVRGRRGLDILNIIQKELDIESLASSANQKIKAANKGKVITKALPPFDPDDPNSPWSYDRTDVKNEVTERIKQVHAGWHQGTPFNDLLPLLPPDYTQRAYTGCAMVAVSQIMAYHQKPYSNYITAAMWPTMIANLDTSVELKRLMLDLFNTMNTGYDATGTSSNISKARDFLNNNGYTAGSAQDYTFDRAWRALSYGPTYIRGTRASGDGHAWIIDGVRNTRTTSTDIYTITYNGRVFEASGSSSITSFQTVRYDWGGGNENDNTWFNSGIFTPSSNTSPYDRNVRMISYVY